MTKCNKSVVFQVSKGEKAIAMMIRGTSDSLFQLERGVPSNELQRLDEFLWADVFVDGFPVQLTAQKTNPLVIEIPGTYSFRNEGTDDEQAIVDVTVYK